MGCIHCQKKVKNRKIFNFAQQKLQNIEKKKIKYFNRFVGSKITM